MTPNFPTLPAGWEIHPLEKIAFLNMGQSPDSSTYNSEEIGLPFFQGKKDFGKLHPKPTQYCSAPVKIAQPNDILMSVRAPVGPTNIANTECCIGRGLAAIRANHKILDLFYLHYFFKYFETEISEMGKGSTFAAITKAELANLQIPLPPLEEQKRLVSLLDTLFAKIDRSVELLDENIAAADALLPSALNTVFREDIVQEWEKHQFDKISKFIDYRGKTPTKTEDGTILITAKNVRFGYLSDEPREYIADTDYEGWMTRGIPNQGDVIFTTEAPLGNVAILNTNEKRAFAQRIVTFQSISDVYDSIFLYWYMLSPLFQKELNDNATGTTVKGIKTAILKKFKIPLPPLDIQNETVAYLDNVRDKVEMLKKVQNDKKSRLITLKASILDRAFKGEL